MSADGALVQFHNCKQLYKNAICNEDFWIRSGEIKNPEKVFFSEKKLSDVKIDCEGLLIVPGFIDAQINGGFGYDFSSSSDTLNKALDVVSKEILQHGVTSYCPTLVTSTPEFYKEALPKLTRKDGGAHGAQILGAHCEGPFINIEKKGAHNPNYVQSEAPNDIVTFVETYGSLDNISIVTVAPELPGILETIPQLVEKNIVVSIGHSMANCSKAEQALLKGSTFITHLFNAMLPFHHRDPGIVGLLTSFVKPKRSYYGLISDGIHTHPTAMRIAQRSHPTGAILVTDAMAALGLPPGVHKLGSMDVVINKNEAKIVGTETLAGSVISMDEGVRHYLSATGCSVVEAVNTATLQPAELLGITDRKGTLDYETDADFLLLDHNLIVQATFIAGKPVWVKDEKLKKKLGTVYDL